MMKLLVALLRMQNPVLGTAVSKIITDTGDWKKMADIPDPIIDHNRVGQKIIFTEGATFLRN